MKTLSMSDEITAIRALILEPTLKTPDASWAIFSKYMQDKHGIVDIESPAGAQYIAEFNKSPTMKSLLDYMLRRAP